MSRRRSNIASSSDECHNDVDLEEKFFVFFVAYVFMAFAALKQHRIFA